MSLASRMMDRFRKRLTWFVEKERARAGCAKAGMKVAARKLGMSTVAIYRAMNGYGPVCVRMHHYGALILHTVLAKPERPRTVRASVSLPGSLEH